MPGQSFLCAGYTRPVVTTRFEPCCCLNRKNLRWVRRPGHGPGPGRGGRGRRRGRAGRLGRGRRMAARVRYVTDIHKKRKECDCVCVCMCVGRAKRAEKKVRIPCSPSTASCASCLRAFGARVCVRACASACVGRVVFSLRDFEPKKFGIFSFSDTSILRGLARRALWSLVGRKGAPKDFGV